MSDHGAGHDSDHGAAHEHALRELAAAYGVAIDYWDWQGRHVVVSTESLVAVLAALDVDASTADAAAGRADGTGRRGLAADAAAGAGDAPGLAADVRGARPRRLVRSTSGSSSRRANTAAASSSTRTGTRPATIDGELSARRRSRSPATCRWVTTGCSPAPATAGADAAGRHAALGRPAGPARRPPRTGGWPTQLYSVRSAGSPGAPATSSTSRTWARVAVDARRRLRARQPAARRRAGRADGALAVPPDDAALRQPAVPPARADPRVRRPRAGRQGAGSTRSAVRPWPPAPSGSTVTGPGRPSARRCA